VNKKIRLVIGNSSEDSLMTLKKLIEQNQDLKIIGEGRNGEEIVDLY
jgi:hypothetical protein